MSSGLIDNIEHVLTLRVVQWDLEGRDIKEASLAGLIETSVLVQRLEEAVGEDDERSVPYPGHHLPAWQPVA